MIISLGILSIFQLTFVPGLILARAFKIHGFWENLLAAIGLSQIFNYVFVILAVFFKIYTQTTVLILFGIEVVLLLVFYFPDIKWNLGKILTTEGIRTFFKDYTSKITPTEEWKKKVLTFFYYFAFFLAVYCLIKNFFLYVTEPTQIFTGWDAVASWNKWAIHWSRGIFPTETWHYPQLLPTNLSIPYQFIGTTDVKYFSKYFANLIDFAIIFIVFILGIKKKEVGYFLGVFFTSWLMFAFGSRGSGYADSPVAFWALLTNACLLFAEDHKDERKLILLGAFFVSAAALTKQAGLWLVLTYPILIALRKSEKPKKSKVLIIQSIAIMILMIVPWYLYKEIQIKMGIETSEIERVTSLVLNKDSVYLIIDSAHKLFLETIKNPYFSMQITFLLLLIFIGFSYKDRFWSKICSLVIIPFWIGWIFFFSYENRNLDMIIPLMAICAGVGLGHLIQLDWNKVKPFFQQKWLQTVIESMRSGFSWLINVLFSLKIWYFLILIPLIFILPHWVSDERLIKNSLFKQMYIGDAPVNQQIYDYKTANGLDGKILTTYEYMGFLPGLEEDYVYSLSDIPEFINRFNDPEIGYALLNDHWWSGEVKDYVMSLIEEGKITLIFEYDPPSQNGKYYFVTTCHGVCK